LSIDDVQSFVTSAIGGENVGEMVLGRSRFPINVRYPRELRDSLEQLRSLVMLTPMGARIRLGDIARIVVNDGPTMVRSENGRLSGWVYVDLRGRDLRTAVRDMQKAVAREVTLPAGYSVSWSGQFEYLERAAARLKLVAPVTLAIIFLLLYVTLRSVADALLLMSTVPFALVGGIWFVWVLGHAFSVATAVGFLALAGVAAEFGVVMLIYLKSAWARHRIAPDQDHDLALVAAIHEGAVMRVRPKAMTVAVILAGLFPIMRGEGAGSEVMQRIAAPMLGGMISAPLLSMLVIPAAYLLMHRRRSDGGGVRPTWAPERPAIPSHTKEAS
jgi:Cu(I)/Ag(I) efflux system membrane protein CusA/SilA